MTNLRR